MLNIDFVFSEYNPRLSEVTPTTRVAYAKFMKNKFKSDFKIREERERHGSAHSVSSTFFLEDEVFEKSNTDTAPPDAINLKPKLKFKIPTGNIL